MRIPYQEGWDEESREVQGASTDWEGVFLPGFAEGENPHRGKFNFGNSAGWMGDLEQMMAMGMKK